MVWKSNNQKFLRPKTDNVATVYHYIMPLTRHIRDSLQQNVPGNCVNKLIISSKAGCNKVTQFVMNIKRIPLNLYPGRVNVVYPVKF